MSTPSGLALSIPNAVAALRRGDRRVLARMLSSLEDGGPAGSMAMAQIREQEASARVSVLAITGPPGVGKSTLVSALARRAAESGSQVAVLAVDPSSPLTGGAVLGDRVRMVNDDLGDGIFIRSFANRGRVGGLARVIPDAVDVVAAAGYDLVFIETVGVGQSEIEVSRYADVTAVVLAPYLGDEIQAAKAGLMEIADVFIVNKCDLPGADRAVRDVRSSTRMRHVGHMDVPVLKVAATTGDHIDEAWHRLAALLAEASAVPGSFASRVALSRVEELASATADALRQSSQRGSIAASSVVGRFLEGRLTMGDALAQIERLMTSDPA